MAEFDPVERIISGKGIITIPEDWDEALQILLYTSVVRDVVTPSKNLTFNPDKGFYAHICFCIDDYVLYTLDVNFETQVFVIHDQQPSQNLLSLICAYGGILSSLVDIANAVSAVITPPSRINEHPYLQFKPNKIRFECFSSCALMLTLRGTKLDRCNPEDGSPTPPSPPPPGFPTVPPGTPIRVSPAEPDDPGGQDTSPFPIDMFPDPEPEPTCGLFDVTYGIFNPSGEESEDIIATIRLDGAPSGTFIEPATSGGGLQAGIIYSALVEDVCEPGQRVVVFQGGADSLTIDILEVVEVPQP